LHSQQALIALATARAITLPVARAIIPKSHSNPCDYLYQQGLFKCSGETISHHLLIVDYCEEGVARGLLK